MLLRNIFILFLSIQSSQVSGQDILLSEDFNSCSLPDGWLLTVDNNQDAGVVFGYMQNPKSDSLTVDGTCMVIFDDDALGDGQPSFRAELISPLIDVAGYSNLVLSLDVAFRAYGTSTMEIFVVADGQYHTVTSYGEDNQTGAQMSQAIRFVSDLSFVVEAERVQIAVVYDDDDMYAWWGGVDNFSLVGEDKGETILKEDFNDCSLPAGWETVLITGEHEWQIGLVENDNASANSINGSCFAYFDDDGIGEEVPFSTVELRTPIFDGSAHAEFELNFDLIFRKAVDFENISVYVFDGSEYALVEDFIEAVGGPQFNEYEAIVLDLTPYRSASMQVVFRYEDGNSWGWWVGIDNVKILGRGEVNDICSKAIPITINAGCTRINNANAVRTGPVPSCTEEYLHTLWYSVVADRSGILKLENTTDYNDILTVYSGDCGTLAELQCIDKDEHGFTGETIFIDLLEGQQITVRAAAAVSRYGKVKGFNCLQASWVQTRPLGADLDLIVEAAEILADGECITVNSSNAGTESFLPLENELARADVWLRFECQEAGNYLIESDADFSESLTVFEVGAASTEELINNNFGKSLTIADAIAGNTYAIQVAGLFATIEGGACITLKKVETSTPSNDDCVEALDIAVGDFSSVMNVGNTFSGIYPTCNVYSTADVWAIFNTGTNAKLYLGSSANFPHVLTIYSGDCNDLEEVWCRKGRNICEGHFEVNGLETNTDYYLQVSSDLTSTHGGEGLVNMSLQRDLEEDPLGVTINEICDGEGSGTLEIIPFGGYGNYTITGTQSGEELSAGEEYLVVVVDEEGCEVARKGTVGCQPSNCMFQLQAQVQNVSCHDAEDGAIVFTVEQAVEPVSFVWSEGSISGGSPINLEAGTYQVTATDGNLCVVVAEYIITKPALLSSELTSTDESGPGNSDGNANVQVGGGTFPYSFLWSNGATSSAVSDLAPANYSVTVTDARGCTEEISFTISPFNCIEEVILANTPASCFDGNDGSLVISDPDNSIVSVIWNTGATGTEINGLSPGTYIATVTFDNGCEKIETYEVISPNIIELVLDNQSDVVCAGEANGSVSLLAQGGVGTFEFSWEDGLTTNERTDLAAGLHTVTISDGNGCEQLFDIEIAEPAALSIASTMASDVSCFGDADGAICAFAAGGVEPYDFDWGDALPAMSKVENLLAGIYPLTIIDENGCLLQSEIIVGSPEEIEIETVAVDARSDGTGSASIAVSGGTSPYDVEWFLEGESIAIGLEATDLFEGLYDVVVTDSLGCQSTTAILLYVTATIDNIENTLVQVYPNPTTNYIIIDMDFPAYGPMTIIVLDAAGKLVLEKQLQGQDLIRLDTRTFLSGTYQLQLNMQSYNETVSFVVVR